MNRERVVGARAGQWEGKVRAGECCCRAAAAAVSQSCMKLNC